MLDACGEGIAAIITICWTSKKFNRNKVLLFHMFIMLVVLFAGSILAYIFGNKLGDIVVGFIMYCLVIVMKLYF